MLALTCERPGTMSKVIVCISIVFRPCSGVGLETPTARAKVAHGDGSDKLLGGIHCCEGYILRCGGMNAHVFDDAIVTRDRTMPSTQFFATTEYGFTRKRYITSRGLI